MSHDITIAKALAYMYHAGQMYGNEPYINHLQQVADNVAAGTTDERMVIVAWLHDILEDTPCTIDTLKRLFEDNVVHAVDAITRWPGMDKLTYLQAVKGNHLARMVKIHDLLCNLRASVMCFDARRIQKYTEQIAYLVKD